MDNDDARQWLYSGSSRRWAVINNGTYIEDTIVALFTTEEQADTFLAAYENADYYIQQLEEV